VSENPDVRIDVQEVMRRYTFSVDTRDLATYATCFAEDVTVTGFGTETIKGRKAWVAYNERALQKYAATHHLLGNQDVVLDGEALATMRSYVQATHVLAEDPSILVVLWGRYDDDLVRIDGEWRITRHHLERLIPVSLIRRLDEG
jgi:uncharacterized protein (TIGR02246 family)